MPTIRGLLLSVGLMTLGSTACATNQSRPRSDAGPPATRPAEPATRSSARVIEFPRHTLVFQPTRDDMTVGRVVFSVYCSQPDQVRLNGVRPDPAWMDVRIKEGGIEVETRSVGAREEAHCYVVLPQTGRNRFELAPLKLELADDGGLVCISVKAWFNEITNQYDSMYYQNVDDRYALVSYCTHPPDASPVRARFKQNRVENVDEFREKLSMPIAIRLNQRPLREEWSR